MAAISTFLPSSIESLAKLGRPSMCQKSGVMLPVGESLAKTPLFEVQSHFSSRFTAYGKEKSKSFPTASL